MRPKNEHKNSVITIDKNTYIVKQKPNKSKPIISASYSALRLRFNKHYVNPIIGRNELFGPKMSKKLDFSKLSPFQRKKGQNVAMVVHSPTPFRPR